MASSYQDYLNWAHSGQSAGWWSQAAAKAAKDAGIGMYIDTAGWTQELTPWGEQIWKDPSGNVRSIVNPAWTQYVQNYVAQNGGGGTGYGAGAGGPGQNTGLNGGIGGVQNAPEVSSFTAPSLTSVIGSATTAAPSLSSVGQSFMPRLAQSPIAQLGSQYRGPASWLSSAASPRRKAVVNSLRGWRGVL